MMTVTAVGNLAADPELSEVNGREVANFALSALEKIRPVGLTVLVGVHAPKPLVITSPKAAASPSPVRAICAPSRRKTALKAPSSL